MTIQRFILIFSIDNRLFYLISDWFRCSFDPIANIDIFKVLQFNAGSVRSLISQMVVFSLFAQSIAVNDKSRITFVTFVSYAEPVRS